MHHRTQRFAAAFVLALMTSVAQAQAQPAQDIHLIWFGGNDCPPCAAWRAMELPKLQAAPEFQGVRFSFVVKSVKSPIPPTLFLPPEVAPLKDKLDEASGGRSGSPKGALVVNGELHDFFQGTRSAADIVAMIESVRNGTRYPFKRCLKASSTSRHCEVTAARNAQVKSQ